MRVPVGVLAVASTLAIAVQAPAQRCGPYQFFDSQNREGYGRAVAIQGDVAVVGTPSFSAKGSASVYRWDGVSWILEQELAGPPLTNGTFDAFGSSVAISGNTIVVGATEQDIAFSNQGAVHVFVYSGNAWVHQSQLTAPDAAASDNFGGSVAIDGNTLVASAPLDNVGATPDRGTLHVFVRSGSTWSHQEQLFATDGSASDSLGGYGSGVSISGDTIVAGARNDQVGPNTAQGSAYVFVRSGAAWTEQAKLVAADGSSIDNFGQSVSIAGDTVAVGVPQDDFGTAINPGTVRVFSRVAAAWSEVALLTPPNVSSNLRFGASVSAFADSILAGATGASSGNAALIGAAYIFDRSPSGSTWTPRPTLFAPNGLAGNFGEAAAFDGSRAIVSGRVPPDIATGAVWIFDAAQGQSTGVPEIIVANPADAGAGDKFGLDVAVSGNTMVIGSRDDDIGANANQGSAYVYERTSPGQPWIQVAKLTASDGGAGDELAERVAIEGDTIALSATIHNSARGAVYVFTRNVSGNWAFSQKLTADAPTPGDRFGNDIDIQGNVMVVGAFLDDGQAGSAFVFNRTGTGAWSRVQKLQPGDTLANDFFGTSVAIDSGTIVIGSPGDDLGPAADRGTIAIYAYTPATAQWTLQSKFTASDSTGGAMFGEYVDIDNGTILVGASRQVGFFNGAIQPGAAYVFTGSGSVWTQQARLDPTDTTGDDRFGSRLILRDDTAVIGSTVNDHSGKTDAGAAYVFARTGNSWTFRQKVTAFDGQSNDSLGAGLEIDGNTLLVGSGQRLVGTNAQQGAVYAVSLRDQCIPVVRNLTLNTTHATLAEALSTSATGQQIAASSSAWGNITALDTLGRSIGFSSTGWLATPPSSIITLGGASYLASGTDQPVEIFGQLRVSSNSSADVSGSGFLLGSRGTLTARTGSSLSISTPSASLLGTTRLEPGAAFTLAGSASNSGVLTAAVNASIVANGPLSSSGALTLTAGTITTPTFSNTGQADIFGSSAIFGSFTNALGATTTIRSGSLFVFGSLTNNGTIIGTICASCLGTPPNMDVSGDLTIGAAGNLSMPFADSVVRVGGNFDCAINDSARFNLALATLLLDGATPVHEVEVMSRNIGADRDGLDVAPGRFPIGSIRVGPTPGIIRLVDRRDNDGQGQTVVEAIYVKSLQIDAGSRLDNSAGKVYYQTLVNNGTVDVPANLIQLPQPCAADFDQSGVLDFVDIFTFLNAWFAGNSIADFNQSGELDIGDIFSLLNAWFAGC